MNLSEYQRQFLGYVFGDSGAPVLANADVYRFGIEAKAVRALGYQYPTVKALVGPSVFQGLATDYFRMMKKQSGDWADFGWGFPGWIASHRVSDQVPYIPDVSRLDSHVSQVERIHYDELDVEGFSVIEEGLARCTLILNGAVQFFRSTHPVVSIWEAHKSPNPRETLSFAQARRMIAKGQGQNALVFRSGGRGMVQAVPERDFLVLEHLKEQRSIAQALGEDLLLEKNLSGWLQDMIAKRVIVSAKRIH
ncbi:HvfC/BufC family peptide modification chaperone [Marinobacter sp. F4206]|uniref:HvfC/BufC family peptide modification chaperone n=1 Tax=Marinobacter sp. F4206 TaxID=2861777 RepID=UPI001C5F9218|nr:putative DNA-binding domain-containing protein [Marinobacter sp. F4206]MBW4933139.1 DNA-binding domain-containing protein [Marinobacter sp. F4206]